MSPPLEEFSPHFFSPWGKNVDLTVRDSPLAAGRCYSGWFFSCFAGDPNPNPNMRNLVSSVGVVCGMPSPLPIANATHPDQPCSPSPFLFVDGTHSDPPRSQSPLLIADAINLDPQGSIKLIFSTPKPPFNAPKPFFGASKLFFNT